MWECRDAAPQQTHSNQQLMDCAADCPRLCTHVRACGHPYAAMQGCCQTPCLFCSFPVCSMHMSPSRLAGCCYSSLLAFFLACSGMNSLASGGLRSTTNSALVVGRQPFLALHTVQSCWKWGGCCMRVYLLCVCARVCGPSTLVDSLVTCLHAWLCTHHCLWAPERCQGGGGEAVVACLLT